MRLALLVAGSLSQIGEFSFILATLIAGTYKLLPMEAVNVITGVAIISITINAACYRFVPRLISSLEKREIGVSKKGRVPMVEAPTEDRHRVIVVGYGPSGRLMTHLFRKYDLDVVVLEMNIDTIKRLEKERIPCIHGDARLRSILRSAGCEKAVGIIITAPGAPAVEIAESAREVNPEIRVVASTTYIRTAKEVMKHVDSQAFSGEAEVALSMATHMLRSLGATEEQLSRERQHARKNILGIDD